MKCEKKTEFNDIPTKGSVFLSKYAFISICISDELDLDYRFFTGLSFDQRRSGINWYADNDLEVPKYVYHCIGEEE